MEYDYTHLNHNLLVSQKKVVTKGMIIKGGLLCTINLLCVVQLEGNKFFPLLIGRPFENWYVCQMGSSNF
jgi:hypothetical protein